MTNWPLTWPAGWRRTKPELLRYASFSRYGQRLSVADGVKRVFEQLRLLGIGDWNIVVSTNVRPRRDGTPRSDEREPTDPGVAVYWKKKKDAQHKVMATDRYTKVADNLAAIAATLEAMRTIERHGGAVILERVFTGFTALPSPNDWRHVLGFEDTPAYEIVKERYRDLAKKNHSDTGGSDVRMAELNGAWEAAQRELTQ